jgi:phosphoribosyl-AMP cyclohydrolase
VPARSLDPTIAARLKRDERGLVAAVVQQHDTREVLMVGWMDDEALRRSLSEGRVTFWSRSRGEYWRKGDTSGHAQFVRDVHLDCDGDALVVTVDQVGPACHTGARTCFVAGGRLPAAVGQPEPEQREADHPEPDRPGPDHPEPDHPKPGHPAPGRPAPPADEADPAATGVEHPALPGGPA